MTKLKLTSVGTSVGAIIPKEMLARLKLGKGDTLYALEAADGYLLTPYDPEIEEQLQTGQDFLKEYRDVFKALASR